LEESVQADDDCVPVPLFPEPAAAMREEETETQPAERD
jgi:hypothetical protein